MTMNEGEAALSLSYQITQKNQVIIVAFAGTLSHDNLAALEKLQLEINGLDFSWVVLHFKGVPERADQTTLPHLAKIQKSIRDKGAKVRLSSLHPKLRRLLQERGVLRNDEYVEDLAQTLQWLAKDAA